MHLAFIFLILQTWGLSVFVLSLISVSVVLDLAVRVTLPGISLVGVFLKNG